MTLNKKTITILTLVMAVGAISMTYAATTFFGEDCTIYDPEMGAGKVCNDLNNLNDRVTAIEDLIYYPPKPTLSQDTIIIEP